MILITGDYGVIEEVSKLKQSSDQTNEILLQVLKKLNDIDDKLSTFRLVPRSERQDGV